MSRRDVLEQLIELGFTRVLTKPFTQADLALALTQALGIKIGRGAIGTLGSPVMYLGVLGFGLGPIFQRAGEGSYLQFMAPGIMSMTILFTSTFSGMALLWDRQFGFLKETLVAPVPRLTIMVGRTVGGATVALFQGLLVFGISLLAGFRPANAASAL